MMQNCSGLTLMELLVVLMIITILTSIALPGQRALSEQHQGAASMRGMASLIKMARSEAVRQGSIVTICPSVDQQRCGGQWQQGVMVFLDPSAQRQPSREEDILRLQQWPQTGGTLHWRAFGNRQFLHIDPLGQMRYQSGNFTWCPASNDARQAQQLIINGAGRIRLARDNNGDGWREDSQGRRLRCP